jgi:segregation and condensation protein B
MSTDDQNAPEPDATDDPTSAADASHEPPVESSEPPVDRPEEPVEAVQSGGPRLGAEQLLGIVEALVFASPEPLSLKTLTKVLSDEPKEDVVAAVQALMQQYERPGGLHVVEIAGGYQITTRPEYHEWVRRLFHERTTQKLSVQSLETLAVIAYKQPITGAEIGEIRGVNTSGVLSTLLERHLIKIVGRKNVIGRPFLYGTTREFLIRFGLKDLTDLPRVEDMAAALGFDAPAILRERSVTEEMLPLDESEAESDDA